VGDEELVLQVARGELTQLGRLFDLYHLPVRRFLARLQVPPGDLDDLVQLTFLQVPRAAPRFDPQRAVKGWLASRGRSRRWPASPFTPPRRRRRISSVRSSRRVGPTARWPRSRQRSARCS